MNILITGGLGKIGSYLSRILSEKYNVTILDNFSNNVVDKIPNTNVIKGDIRDNIDFDVDIIIHTAAQTSINKSINDPLHDADNNIRGTLNILEFARKSDIKKFIYISSAAVYGIPIYLPIDEKHPVDPISPYGLSKLTGERYSMLYYNLYNIPVVHIRLFNVFGFLSDDSYSGVISKFIDRIGKNQCPIIYGDGNQTRDFIYIDDIVGIIVKLLDNDKNTIGEIFNVGTGKPAKILDLSNMITMLYRKSLLPEFLPYQKGDIRESYANITKMRKIYEPKYSLEKGLKIMIDTLK